MKIGSIILFLIYNQHTYNPQVTHWPNQPNPTQPEPFPSSLSLRHLLPSITLSCSPAHSFSSSQSHHSFPGFLAAIVAVPSLPSGSFSIYLAKLRRRPPTFLRKNLLGGSPQPTPPFLLPRSGAAVLRMRFLLRLVLLGTVFCDCCRGRNPGAGVSDGYWRGIGLMMLEVLMFWLLLRLMKGFWN